MNKALLKELLQLSAAERLELANELLERIPDEQYPPLTPEQMAEIERRIDEHERDPGRAIPWEEIREWLWSRRK
jgi:putative addiction module component (TIGR02574 family)